MKLVKTALPAPVAAISIAIFAIVNAGAAVLEVGEGKAYTDIATAIGDAKDYDTVLVHDGIYGITEQISVTKAIALKSVNGAAVTEIKRTDRGDPLKSTSKEADIVKRVLLIDNADAVVDGFTISGGYVYSYTSPDVEGGGVRIGTVGGTLRNCVVTNNVGRKNGHGAGVAVLGASGVVSNCVINFNTSLYVAAAEGYAYGCGVYMTGGLVTHCDISGNNKADSSISGQTGGCKYGGGVYMTGGRVSHCTITNNIMNASGNNGMGGGLYATAGLVDNCLIADNRARNNSTSDTGGGAYLNGAVTLINCTVAGNTATTHGGISLADSSARLVNTLVYGNVATSATHPEFTSGKLCVMSNCYSSSRATFPAKAVACKTVDDAGFGEGYVLLSTSPCIDKGWDDALDAMTDLAGNKRYDGDAIDVGCFEYQIPQFSAEIQYSYKTLVPNSEIGISVLVNSVKEGERAYRWSVDGEDWGEYAPENTIKRTFASSGNHAIKVQVKIGDEEEPVVEDVLYVAPSDIHVAKSGADYTEIATALSFARAGSVVHVAAGVYEVEDQVSVGAGITLKGDEGAAVTEIRRTDAGIVGVSLAASDPAVNKRVLYVNGAGAKAEGLAISGGYLRGMSGENGAGACIGPSGGSLVGCLVTNNFNRTSSLGAGVALMSADAIVSNCVIAFNSSIRISAVDGETEGGGVYIPNGLLVDSAIISNNLSVAGVQGTGSGVLGGGIYMLGGRVSRCQIVGNYVGTANQGGGAGIYMQSQDALVDNCLISSNRIVTSNNSRCGGGIFMAGGGTLLNCTVVDNSAPCGGGVGANSARALVHNSIVQDNHATNEIGGDDYATNDLVIESSHFYYPAVRYSICPEEIAGEGNLVGSVTFSDADFHLAVDSLGLRKGTVVGYESRLLGGIDLDGMPRTVTRKKLIDMGCYQREYRPGLMLLVR